jgi:broad specificity phosphatase PhoE
MSETLPVVCLARHGETAWSLSGQHTGLTDLPLTDRGERNARKLGEQLRLRHFARVFTSPLQRAARTCELAGFGAQSEVDRDLVEWNYGEYEGLRTGRSMPSARAGNCSATVVPEGNRQPRLERGLIAWLTACVQ